MGGVTMGTTYSIVIADAPVGLEEVALHGEVEGLLARINQTMSTYIPDSELMRINRDASGDWLPVSRDLFEVIAAARVVSELSGGAFDITVGSLVNLWGFGVAPRGAAPPRAERVERARANSGYTLLELDRDTPAVRKRRPGLFLDLSAIAKGYAVDRIAALLEQKQVSRYLVEIGGEVRARGANPRGEPWRIGIEHPRGEPWRSGIKNPRNEPWRGGTENSRAGTWRSDIKNPRGEPWRNGIENPHGGVASNTAPIRVLELQDMALATSGDYRNFFEHQGRRYPHTIDPASAEPIHHTLASVTVLHPSCMLADALATAILAAGPKQGLQLANKNNLPALLIHFHNGKYTQQPSRAFRTLFPQIEKTVNDSL